MEPEREVARFVWGHRLAADGVDPSVRILPIVDLASPHRLYHPAMLRLVAVLASVLTTSTIGMAYPANADPGDAPEPSCTYTLSPPSVVQVSGATMVTATLTPFPCTGSINPNSMTVCVSMQGDSSTGQCASEAKPVPAQVYFAPYRPGAVYTSRGTGCGSVYTGTQSVCTTVGPFTATL